MELQFEYKKGYYESVVNGGTKYLCGITTTERCPISIRAKIGDMNSAVVGVTDNPYGNTSMFILDFPTDVQIIIRTSTEVKECFLLPQ